MYRIFDSHAHIYPDKIASKASDAIGKFYDISMRYDGSVDALLKEGTEAGIERFLVHSVATVAQQVESINNFILRQCAAHPDRFTGFAAMHPDYENPYDELLRVKQLGLKGVKLHPDFQKFAISDESMDEAYEAMEQLEMPVLFHTGDRRYNWSSPVHVPVVLKKHPHLKVICAHFGAYSQWSEAENCLRGLDVYVDTSSSLTELDDDTARRLIHSYGAERVMFGTDYPMWNAAEEIERLLRLKLTPREYEMIFSDNMAKLLAL